MGSYTVGNSLSDGGHCMGSYTVGNRLSDGDTIWIPTLVSQ